MNKARSQFVFCTVMYTSGDWESAPLLPENIIDALVRCRRAGRASGVARPLGGKRGLHRPRDNPGACCGRGASRHISRPTRISLRAGTAGAERHTEGRVDFWVGGGGPDA